MAKPKPVGYRKSIDPKRQFKPTSQADTVKGGIAKGLSKSKLHANLKVGPENSLSRKTYKTGGKFQS